MLSSAFVSLLQFQIYLTLYVLILLVQPTALTLLGLCLRLPPRAVANWCHVGLVSEEVACSIPGFATQFVRSKSQTFKIGVACTPVARIPCIAVGPIYIQESHP